MTPSTGKGRRASSKEKRIPKESEPVGFAGGTPIAKHWVHRRKSVESGEQEALSVMLRICVEQFSNGTILEYGADGAGQQGRDG